MFVIPTRAQRSDRSAARRPAERVQGAARFAAALGIVASLVLTPSQATAAIPVTAAAGPPSADDYIDTVCAIRHAEDLVKVCSQRRRTMWTLYHTRVTRCVASHLIAPVTPSIWSASVFFGKFNYWWVRCWKNNAEGW